MDSVKRTLQKRFSPVKRRTKMKPKVPFNQGDTVAVANPFVFVVSSNAKSSACDRCLYMFKKGDVVQQCKSCRRMWYCSKTCFRVDSASTHSHRECYLLQVARHACVDLSDRELLIIRLLAREVYSKEGLLPAVELYKGLCAKTGASGVTTPNMDPDAKKMVNKIMKKIAQIWSCVGPAIAPLSQEEFDASTPLLIKAHTNSVYITDALQHRIGVGMYIGDDVFGKHYCVPNVAPVFVGTEMTIRALRHIDKDEPLKMSFIDLTMPDQDRQAALATLMCLQCTSRSCKRCAVENKDHVYKGLNYHKLIRMRELMLILAIDMPVFEQVAPKTHSAWLALAFLSVVKYLDDFQNAYGRYHPELTVVLFYLAEIRFRLTNQQVLAIAEKVPMQWQFLLDENCFNIILTNAISITHGTEHPLFKKMLRLERAEVLEFLPRWLTLPCAHKGQGGMKKEVTDCEIIVNDDALVLSPGELVQMAVNYSRHVLKRKPGVAPDPDNEAFTCDIH